MKTMVKMFYAALLIAFAANVHAEVSETFAGFEDWSYVSSTNFMKLSKYSWYGMAHAEDYTNGIVSVAGYPIAEDAQNKHEKTICAIGDVFVENKVPEDQGDYTQVEYLQQVTIADDYLVSDELDDVQIALAAGEQIADDPDYVDLWLYCLPKGASKVGWVKVGKARLGTFMRVNLAFDYKNQSCRVSTDGIPRMSASGYLLPECDPNGGDGAWYRIGTTATQNERKSCVSSLQFTGMFTRWDDVKITEQNFYDHAPFPAHAEINTNLVAAGIDPDETPHWLNVSLNDLNRWAIDDVVDTTTIRLDKSGHTVKEKLELGYDPLDGKKFAPTNMAMQVNNDGSQRVTLTIPKAKADSDLRYFIRATGTNDNNVVLNERLPAERDTLTEGTAATCELPADSPRVIFFQLEAERVGD